MLTEKEQEVLDKINSLVPYEYVLFLTTTIKQLKEAQERELTFTLQLRKENERIKHIAGLLASRIKISDEVFDYLSMEEDYEFYADKALKGE